MSENNEIREEQKTFKGEIVDEQSPGGLWDLEVKGERLRNNPYKMPPNNLTTKRRDANVKG